ncbi:MAG: response regulator [Alphaproteobacteria bacterium]
MGKTLHILLIDDDPPVRVTVEAMLGRLGHRVTTAGNGVEGIQKLREIVPDVVLTDIIMPEKEGIETIMEIRRSHREIKIIAMSGGGPTRNLDFLRFAERLGAHAVLAKPFGLDDLQRVLTQAQNDAPFERD